MHTPQGYEMIDGVAHAVDWWAIIFNPSLPYRLTHMLLASGLTAAFLISGISAYRILRGDNKLGPRLALKTGVTVAAVLIPIQIFVGDLHGLNTLEHQPQKIAAVEAVWHTEQGAPLVLFAWPDEVTKQNLYSIEIPKLASLILTHEMDGEIRGLNEFEGDHPPVKPLFFGFRIMVAIGTLMLLISWVAAWFVWRKDIVPSWLLKSLVAMTFSGWIATLAGWYVTEIGRQPWLVTGILKTSDAVTNVPASNVAMSLTMYLIVYAILLFFYLQTIFYMARKSVLVEEFDLEKLQSEERKEEQAAHGEEVKA
jgi:cytochrome d ubiquinol oxidase subunit I